MTSKEKNLEQPKYDPKKDLQKIKRPGKPLEPTPKGKPINS